MVEMEQALQLFLSQSRSQSHFFIAPSIEAFPQFPCSILHLLFAPLTVSLLLNFSVTRIYKIKSRTGELLQFHFLSPLV